MKRFLLASVAATALGGAAFAQSQPPKTEETLTHDQIKATVDSHVADLKACMKENGAVTGKVIVNFGVMPNGHVVDSKAKEHSSNAGLDKCIVGAFAKWPFPKRGPGAPIQGVDYPLVFTVPKVVPPPPLSEQEQKDIALAIQGHSAEVKKCYEAAKEEKPDLEGIVNIDITIAQNGKVLDSQIRDSTLKFPKVENCINDALKKWTLPQRQVAGNITVGYPFKLIKVEKKK